MLSLTRKFQATQNLPYGIKKGNVLIFENGKLTNSEGEVIPLNPLKETDFFQEVPFIGEFAIGSAVCLLKPAEIEPTGQRKYVTVPAYTKLTVKSYQKSKNRLYVVVDWEGRELVLAQTGVIVYREYFFISSEGKIQSARVGKNKAADNYRSFTGNFYTSKEEAQEALRPITEGMKAVGVYTEEEATAAK